MSEVLGQWPVVVELAVSDGDRDDEGVLTEAAVERLFADGRAAYVAACPELDLGTLTVRDVVVRRGNVAAPGATVHLGVAVVEVFPDSFTMQARIRPFEGEGIAASATCVLVPAGGVADELKARLIALAQTARHHL